MVRLMIIKKSMSELIRLLERKEISALELAKEHIKRIQSLNDIINAYITVNEKNLLEDAKLSDERRAKGALLSKFDGIPIAIKDNIATKDIRTTCASKILENFIPPYDATAYVRLKKMGFLTLGKTNLDEFAMGSTTETSYFGATRNPYNTGRVPGGSSGGSAAAVSAFMAPAALGSDTGGSIRLPAAFCGVVGIKPTYGRVSRYGLVAYASSLDQIGTFGRSVDDAAALLAAISGRDPMDSTSIESPVDFTPEEIAGDTRGMVIGVPEEYFTGVSEEIATAVRKKISELESSGARVENISLRFTEYSIPVYYLIATAEASSNLARYDGIKYGYTSPRASNLAELYTRTRSQGFGKEVKRRIILGTFSLSSGYYDAYYLKALKARTLIIRDFTDAFSKVDVIVAPVSTTTAFKIGELIDDPLQMYMMDVLTTSANLAGIPAISVPAGLDSAGLPIGVQIMASHFGEKKLFAIARAMEKNSETISPEI